MRCVIDAAETQKGRARVPTRANRAPAASKIPVSLSPGRGRQSFSIEGRDRMALNVRFI
jgi:hypothetical protein